MDDVEDADEDASLDEVDDAVLSVEMVVWLDCSAWTRLCTSADTVWASDARLVVEVLVDEDESVLDESACACTRVDCIGELII